MQIHDILGPSKGNSHLSLESSTYASIFLCKLPYGKKVCQVAIMWHDDIAGHHNLLLYFKGKLLLCFCPNLSHSLLCFEVKPLLYFETKMAALNANLFLWFQANLLLFFVPILLLVLGHELLPFLPFTTHSGSDLLLPIDTNYYCFAAPFFSLSLLHLEPIHG